MQKKDFLLLVIILFTGRVYAQTIRPGDNTIDYNVIRPSHQFYKNVTWDTSGNIKYEFMMENVIKIDSSKQRITFSRSRQVPVGFMSADTSVTDFSFRPVSMHEVHIQQKRTYEMSFSATAATVRKEFKGAVTNKTYPMNAGYFEDNMIEYIFGYLKIKRGVTYTLNNFNEARGGNDPYTIKYVFDDSLDLPGYHQLNCSVLAFTHGGTTGLIWIGKNTREMIKQLGQFKGGTYVVVKL
ncbi:hypothetical protein [Mucilaginibacter sp. L3T2-6]|uniref:hypothetical protein n=1 Tax=Mucilaginibacter sp. L3T2-6 TaxID=3062491 RepID=UPI002674812B|nr:hypothetical protein [Mucilaginibacter sp. L3T2-6]MDO3641843.1 hypothetical protein [Mucilaginibacter sp. L3T2-6]MDV6214479.1 hypothetical protein [Mucilaginibacter sp. L3T2-6]